MKKYKFIINGQDYDVEIGLFDGKNATVNVNGAPYNVEMVGEPKTSKTPVLARKPVVNQPGEGQIQRNEGEQAFKVISPLPGSIFKLNVKVGDTVKEGDCLIVMEAMKMENNVISEKSGVVKAIRVKIGDNVLQGDTLIEIA
jgi:biotin carboxyl carrier protein